MEQGLATVPRGVPGNAKGQWIRKAAIRRMTGHDEQLLMEHPASTPLHSKVVSLLERIATFEGAHTSVVLKKLSLGDRACLLLSARKLIIGDLISCTTSCPSCGADMSLDLSADTIMSAEHPIPEVDYGLEAAGFRLRIRPLTAEDQDAIVAKAARSDVLAQELARACVVRSEPALPERIPEALLEAIGSRLEEIDPLSDVNLRLLCPECGHSFQAALPVEEFVLRELGVRGHQLEREVHWLAFHYHWSENEILSLPTSKRKRYVELVNATLAGGSL
ncbi:MAG: hypothetical protein HRF40_12580 [Nitrososphaera sp.]|jgi:hypothetical protein